MSQDVNFIIKEGATFSKLLYFKVATTTQTNSSSVISGIPNQGKTTTRTVMDVTGIEFKGSIRKGLASDSEKIMDLTVDVIDGVSGKVMVALRSEQTAALPAYATSNHPAFDYKGDQVTRLLGYYDIFAKRPNEGGFTRVFKGKVYLSNSMTGLDAFSGYIPPGNRVDSEIIPVTDTAIVYVNKFRENYTTMFRYYSWDGQNYIEQQPTTGKVSVSSIDEYDGILRPVGDLYVAYPDISVSWDNPSTEIRVSHLDPPDNSITHFKVITVSN